MDFDILAICKSLLCSYWQITKSHTDGFGRELTILEYCYAAYDKMNYGTLNWPELNTVQ